MFCIFLYSNIGNEKYFEVLIFFILDNLLMRYGSEEGSIVFICLFV